MNLSNVAAPIRGGVLAAMPSRDALKVTPSRGPAYTAAVAFSGRSGFR
jgi:hypothetical protein